LDGSFIAAATMSPEIGAALPFHHDEIVSGH
jgi:hypothetical protein